MPPPLPAGAFGVSGRVVLRVVCPLMGAATRETPTPTMATPQAALSTRSSRYPISRRKALLGRSVPWILYIGTWLVGQLRYICPVTVLDVGSNRVRSQRMRLAPGGLCEPTAKAAQAARPKRRPEQGSQNSVNGIGCVGCG